MNNPLENRNFSRPANDKARLSLVSVMTKHLKDMSNSRGKRNIEYDPLSRTGWAEIFFDDFSNSEEISAFIRWIVRESSKTLDGYKHLKAKPIVICYRVLAEDIYAVATDEKASLGQRRTAFVQKKRITTNPPGKPDQLAEPRSWCQSRSSEAISHLARNMLKPGHVDAALSAYYTEFARDSPFGSATISTTIADGYMHRQDVHLAQLPQAPLPERLKGRYVRTLCTDSKRNRIRAQIDGKDSNDILLQDHSPTPELTRNCIPLEHPVAPDWTGSELKVGLIPFKEISQYKRQPVRAILAPRFAQEMKFELVFQGRTPYKVFLVDIDYTSPEFHDFQFYEFKEIKKTKGCKGHYITDALQEKFLGELQGLVILWDKSSRWDRETLKARVRKELIGCRPSFWIEMRQISQFKHPNKTISTSQSNQPVS